MKTANYAREQAEWVIAAAYHQLKGLSEESLCVLRDAIDETVRRVLRDAADIARPVGLHAASRIRRLADRATPPTPDTEPGR